MKKPRATHRFRVREGPPLTRREELALTRAAAALPPGSYTVMRGRAKKNPRGKSTASRAGRAYERFHWGEPATTVATKTIPDFSELYELGKATRVDYLTRKGGEEAIWFHEFGEDGGALPTLTATPDGRLGPFIGGAARVTERGIVG